MALFVWKRPRPTPIQSVAVVDEIQELEPASSATPFKIDVKAVKTVNKPSVSGGGASGVSMNVDGKEVSVGSSLGGRREVSRVRGYSVEDGVAVVDGDIVLGVPSTDAPSGFAELPRMALWQTSEIPYHIQPDVVQPGRILDASGLWAFRDCARDFACARIYSRAKSL
ncbi:MAG: hypothetical protein V4692_10330 [Bdellovibrionota bacterium]